MPSEFAPILAPQLDELRADAEVATTFEVIVDSFGAFGRLPSKYLDIAFIVGTGERELADRTMAGSAAWLGDTLEYEQNDRPLPLVLPPQGLAISRGG